jgi:hypothetical protein
LRFLKEGLAIGVDFAHYWQAKDALLEGIEPPTPGYETGALSN